VLRALRGLPVEQKAKDYLFRAVVHALKDIPDAEDAVAKALASLPSPTLAIEGVQAGYIGVQYIGRRDYWQDTLYSSGLTFTKGQARSVPQIVARKLLRHLDLFKQVEGAVAAGDDTAEQLEQGAKTSDKREAERQDFAVIDQMNQISTKAGLAEFALAQFGIKLNMRDKLETCAKPSPSTSPASGRSNDPGRADSARSHGGERQGATVLLER